MPHNWKTYERRVALNLAELMIDCEVDAPDAMKPLQEIIRILAEALDIPESALDAQATALCRSIVKPQSTFTAGQEGDAMAAARRAERALWLQMGG